MGRTEQRAQFIQSFLSVFERLPSAEELARFKRRNDAIEAIAAAKIIALAPTPA